MSRLRRCEHETATTTSGTASQLISGIRIKWARRKWVLLLVLMGECISSSLTSIFYWFLLLVSRLSSLKYSVIEWARKICVYIDKVKFRLLVLVLVHNYFIYIFNFYFYITRCILWDYRWDRCACVNEFPFPAHVCICAIISKRYRDLPRVK